MIGNEGPQPSQPERLDLSDDQMCQELKANISLADNAANFSSGNRSETGCTRILGVNFFSGLASEAARLGAQGGLVVAPAAPNLAQMGTDQAYAEALVKSDLALIDSGFLALLWNSARREKVRRVSGLEYLKALLREPGFRAAQRTIWIMPSEQSRDRARDWLKTQGLEYDADRFYVAPIYSAIRVEDRLLLNFVRVRRPEQVVLAIGGGVQEKLGHYLKTNLDYMPGIHCIGAAIGFLSGDQVNIPDWADKLFLGWFFRCLSQPKRFVPRYWKATRLLALLLRYAEHAPRPNR